MRTGSLRLRRVRFKDGGASLEVFRSRTKEQERADVQYYVRRALDAHDSRIAGFAFVVWTPNSGSTAELRCWEASRIPPTSVPDFVRDTLRHELTERWVRKGLADDPL